MASPAAETEKGHIRAGSPATIAVSVATVWETPNAPRPVDRPALENPVRYREWLDDMTLDERRDLSPTRVRTSVLLGETVQVLSTAGDWAEVVVPSQASPRDPRGYPGWMPIAQLSAHTPPAGNDIATVRERTTVIKSAEGDRQLEVSYATRLPVLRDQGEQVEVWSPFDVPMLVSKKDVVLARADSPALPKDPTSIISDAKRFLGLEYLWDGSSAFGFDCSGITYSVFRTHGVLLPRDSFGQAKVGREVPRSELAPADLVFFAKDGVVHHVGMYIGNNKMLHAPKTGRSVEIVDITTSWFPKEYYISRRYID